MAYPHVVLNVEKDFEAFRRFSSLVGRNPSLTQGPGGNTSLKADGKLWVKASGKYLSEALNEEIFVELSLNEDGTYDKVHASDPLRPSIETFFHSMIPYKFVVHLHSTAAISLSLRKDNFQLLEKYRNVSHVPYTHPGIELAESVMNFTDFKTQNVAILGNHGLLTWGNDLAEISNNIKFIEEIHALHSEVSAQSISRARNLLALGGHKFFTPDHAVFCQDSEGHVEISWIKLMMKELERSISSIPVDIEVLELTSEAVQKLQNWESEKFRLIESKR